MRAVGVIVEYNPFHNGHAYHLERTKIEGQADVVIAVMSGQFLQRGEPALLPKWYRAKMALEAGVDIVFELPYQFATQKAETFARGSVSILAAAGCEALCFGSESGEIEEFHQTLSFLNERNELYQQRIKFHMDKGVSYPTATSSAFKDLSPTEKIINLAKPNNILGYQYIKAIKELSVPMEAITITRKNADYHDEHFSSETIASATSIRKSLFSDNGEINNVEQFVPNTTYRMLQEFYGEFDQFHQWENYWTLLKYRLIQTSPMELRTIYEMEEGLENRLISTAFDSYSFHEFMTKLKTKRYTWTRLQRACVHILTNTKKEVMQSRMKDATYLRLLGMSEKGRQYLNERKASIQLPIISKLSSYDKEDITLDIKASNIYALGANRKMQKKLIEMEYKQPPIYLKDK